MLCICGWWPFFETLQRATCRVKASAVKDRWQVAHFSSFSGGLMEEGGRVAAGLAPLLLEGAAGFLTNAAGAVWFSFFACGRGLAPALGSPGSRL